MSTAYRCISCLIQRDNKSSKTTGVQLQVMNIYLSGKLSGDFQPGLKFQLVKTS